MTQHWRAIGRRVSAAVVAAWAATLFPATASAQGPSAGDQPTASTQPPEHDHAAMLAAQSSSRWTVMGDGVVFVTLNQQGGARGERDVRSQNWLAGMASHPAAGGTLTLSGMFSLEPATVGGRGYSEIFQHGEAYHGLPVVDRQHPHDALMQMAATWQRPFTARTGMVLAGGITGSPAFGPVAFPHRPSTAENPVAPLSHHYFDSTHVTMGVITAGFNVKPFEVLGSVFHGAEPDDQRWDLDMGKLDSWSGQIWWPPAREWSVQGSYAYLHQPEQLEPGNQKRQSASIHYLKDRGGDRFTAVTLAGAQVMRELSTVRALLGEITHYIGGTAIYGRYDGVGLETEHLLFPTTIHRPHPGELIDPLLAYTAGIAREIATPRRFSVAIGAQATTYTVPERLVPTHGRHPVSAQVYVRVRPPRSAMGRMWNMTMTDPMPGHSMTGGQMDHAGMDHAGMVH